MLFGRNQVLLFGKDVDFETHVVLRHTGSAVAPALPVDYLVILDIVQLRLDIETNFLTLLNVLLRLVHFLFC